MQRVVGAVEDIDQVEDFVGRALLADGVVDGGGGFEHPGRAERAGGALDRVGEPAGFFFLATEEQLADFFEVVEVTAGKGVEQALVDRLLAAHGVQA
ncbi:hypothetical protein SDC9_203661 [bioreactor metagenome]|uniref:Uncharacterized protein n=1 Tax=bioreactor metagenome TaxID=1076179 RepID=A0A645IXU9_9ZZZZ